MDSAKKIKVIYGDGHLGLYTDRCTCLFSYSAGGPVSLCIDGHEWLYRAAKPVFWRAVTDNDRETAFPSGPPCGWERICSPASQTYR